MASTRQRTRTRPDRRGIRPARRRPLTVGASALAILGYAVLVYAFGITFEEHDAQRDLGEPYRAYQRRVPALMPALWLRSRRSTPSQGEDTA